jgi:hypothetical protein
MLIFCGLTAQPETVASLSQNFLISMIKKYLVISLVIGLLLAGSLSLGATHSYPQYLKRISGAINPYVSTDTLGSTSNRWAKLWADDIDTTALTADTLTVTSVMGGDILMNDHAIKYASYISAGYFTATSTDTASTFKDATFVGITAGELDLTHGLTAATGTYSGLITATGGITSGSDIISDTDSTDDLGSSTKYWANIYGDNVYCDSISGHTDSIIDIYSSFQFTNPSLFKIKNNDATAFTIEKIDGTDLLVFTTTDNKEEINITGDLVISGHATSSQFYTSTLGLNSEYFTDLSGLGLINSSGSLELEATTSVAWRAIVDDPTGTGSMVFGTSPTFTTGITVPADSISHTELSEGDAFVFTGSVAIPQGNPTIDAAGEIGIDTTEGQFLAYDSELRVFSATSTEPLVLELPVAGDNFIWWRVPYDITITRFDCIGDPMDTTGEHTMMDIWEGDANADSTTTIFYAEGTMKCASTNSATTTFTNAVIDAYDWLGFSIESASGTQPFVAGTMSYKINRK